MLKKTIIKNKYFVCLKDIRQCNNINQLYNALAIKDNIFKIKLYKLDKKQLKIKTIYNLILNINKLEIKHKSINNNNIYKYNLIK